MQKGEREANKTMKTKLIVLLTIACMAATLLLRPTYAQVPGDIDGDGDVDIYDVTQAVSQYWLKPGDDGYNPEIVEKADLAAPYDGIINIFDIVTIVSHYTGSK